MQVNFPLLWPSVGWVAGVAFVRTTFPASGWLVWLVAGLLLACFSRRMRVGVVAALLGMVWGGATLLLDARQVSVDARWMNAPLAVTANVTHIQRQTGFVRLTLNHVQGEDGLSLAGKAWLYLYRHSHIILKEGMQIQANVRWHPPSNHKNPGGFDFSAWCFDRHIALIGSARGDVRVTGTHASWLEKFRMDMRQALARLPDAQSGVLRALLLGDRSHIPMAVSDTFSATGCAHLLAISGLHLGMSALWALMLCWWLLTRREAWIVRLPVRTISMSAGLLLALAYASVAAWPLPAQRAGMMLAGAVAAWWMQERAAPLNMLMAALIVVLLLDAQAVGSVSLWLSFVATAGLLVWSRFGAPLESNKQHQIRRWLIAMFWVTTVSTLVTLPLVTSVFGYLPVYSLPANMLMIPLYSLLILPLALLGELCVLFDWQGVANATFSMAGTLVDASSDLLMMMHHWPGAHLWLATIPLWIQCVYIVGMLYGAYLLWRSHVADDRRCRQRAMLCVLSTAVIYVLIIIHEHAPPVAQFVVWDVGQGAASSLTLADGKVMVVDVPGRPRSRYNGGTTVASGLRSMGEAHVDVLVLSHAQSDHIGGAPRLLAQMRHIGELWLADVPSNHHDARILHIIAQIKAQKGHIRWLKRGDALRFGAAHIKVLWPPEGFAPSNPNNAALTLSLRLPDKNRLLLPADVEHLAESAMQPLLTHHHITLMPHHGSRTSSSQAWVNTVSPEIVIAQTGAHNRYGFPRKEVLARYRDAGAHILNTAQGAVILTFPPSGIQTRQYVSSMEEKRVHALQWWKAIEPYGLRYEADVLNQM